MGCWLFPAAGSRKEPWEGHGWMPDPSRSQGFARRGLAFHRTVSINSQDLGLNCLSYTSFFLPFLFE